MKRYFFHVRDGRTAADTEGTLLPSPQSARKAALRVLASVLLEEGEAFWENPSIAITVRDEEGLVLCSLETVGRQPRPAARSV